MLIQRVSGVLLYQRVLAFTTPLDRIGVGKAADALHVSCRSAYDCQVVLLGFAQACCRKEPQLTSILLAGEMGLVGLTLPRVLLEHAFAHSPFAQIPQVVIV